MSKCSRASTDQQPLLPPDCCHGNKSLGDIDVEQMRENQTIEEARSICQCAKTGHQSSHHDREFVFGAMHKNLFPGCHLVDVSGQNSPNAALEIKLQDGMKTTVRIVNVSQEQVLLDSLVNVGDNLPPKGNCRQNVGDIGDMCALGHKNSKGETCKPTKEVTKFLKRHAMQAVEFMKKRAVEDLTDIEMAEAKKTADLQPSEVMPNGPRWAAMFSRNLGNSGHFNTNDKSCSFAIWAENKPGQVKNWCFILPDASHNNSMGVVVKLFHGCSISWDGRLVHHCTSVMDPGKDNNACACMFGSCRD